LIVDHSRQRFRVPYQTSHPIPSQEFQNFPRYSTVNINPNISPPTWKPFFFFLAFVSFSEVFFAGF
jgi:hypothetical protein